MGTSIRLPPTQKGPKTEKIEIFKKMKKKFLGGSVFDADYRGEVHFAQFRFLKKNFFFWKNLGQKKTFFPFDQFAWAWAYFVQNFFLIILGAPTQKSTYAPTQKWPKTEKNQNFDFDSGY